MKLNDLFKINSNDKRVFVVYKIENGIIYGNSGLEMTGIIEAFAIPVNKKELEQKELIA